MIYQHLNFITIEECSELIGIAETNKYQPGELSYLRIENLKDDSFKYDKPGDFLGTRKALVQWPDENNPLIQKIKLEVSKLSGLPIENQESFHIVKYLEGGEYKKHYDHSSVNPRVKTAMIYLNDSFEGGETYFPKLENKIVPEVGKLIIWDNDRDSLHAGLPVQYGIKYIAVIWIQ
jgi:prolyl 4-hydroxylase